MTKSTYKPLGWPLFGWLEFMFFGFIGRNVNNFFIRQGSLQYAVPAYFGNNFICSQNFRISFSSIYNLIFVSMKNKFLTILSLCCIVSLQSNGQSYKVFKGDTINRLDKQGKKQGLWRKYYSNDSLFSQGVFKDNIHTGTFNFSWSSLSWVVLLRLFSCWFTRDWWRWCMGFTKIVWRLKSATDFIRIHLVAIS